MSHLQLAMIGAQMRYGDLVLEDLVEVVSLSNIWDQEAHLRDVADDEVEKSGEEPVDQRPRIRTFRSSE
jgi:hypothetical protein